MLSRTLRWLCTGELRTFVCITLLASLTPLSFAQGTSHEIPPERLKVLPNLTLARQLLEKAESPGSTDPTSRALLLYRSAGAWLALDAARATNEYRDAFLCARQASTIVRAPLEAAILNELIPLSPNDVAELLPSAELETRKQLFQSLVKYWLFQGDYRRAMTTLDTAMANGVFPSDSAIQLVATIPADDLRNRVLVFGEMLRYCRDHPEYYRSLAFWIARFHPLLPAELVQEAASTVLAQAEVEDKEHPIAVMSEGSVVFHSIYDMTLFEVAKALRETDPDLADKLIAARPEVSNALKRYPNGYESIASYEFALNYSIIPNHLKPMDLRLWGDPDPQAPLNLRPEDWGLEFHDPLGQLLAPVGGLSSLDQHGPEAAVLKQLGACPSDMPQRLSQLAAPVPIARKVPVICTERGCSYEVGYPRLELFESLALGCFMSQKWVDSRAAVDGLAQALDQVPETDRVNFIALTADLYLRLNDREDAGKLVQQGFELASKTFESESKSESLQKVPPGFWPAANIYRRMATLGVFASLDQTEKTVDSISDAELRVFEEVMIARALLGVPLRRWIIVDPNGHVSADQGITYGGTFR